MGIISTSASLKRSVVKGKKREREEKSTKRDGQWDFQELLTEFNTFH